ncbi:MAG: MotA/TolQ/ExbB proton channel family protein [Nitrospinota bacterium]|nr:MotA/TolQ/ExbB proton channel family protein [Nitrospinota bacterium]
METSADGIWLFTVFQRGGPMMWPILVCSILAVAISIERFIKLQKEKVIHPGFLSEVRREWQEKKFDRAMEVCNRHSTPVSRIVRAGLLRWKMGILEIERAVEGAGNHESTLLNANLRGLGVIANIAPMLGLLGTVAGMIKAFNVISTSGSGNAALVANGISEALITTASGLIVGIPTLAIYHFFKGKVEQLIFEMEEVSINFIEEIGYSLVSDEEEPG